MMPTIRRQGETHDSQRVRGPADTRNQVRSISVRIDALADGRLRISSPFARGWARTVRTRDELNRAVAEAFVEAQLASYAHWRGQGYDHDVQSPKWPDDPDPLIASAAHIQARTRNGHRRRDVHNPMDWVPLDDGRWRSPSGKVYGADTDAVRRVQAKRQSQDPT